MNILFFSKNLLAGDLAIRLKNEGHKVKLYIDQKDEKKCLDGLIEKTDNWKKELKWVGKSGLIIFDDYGYGKLQDSLRRKGFAVVGGSVEADKLELHREFAQKIFKQYGLRTVPLKDFKNSKEALNFVNQWRVSWVIKQNNSIDKGLTYVGKASDGSDIIEVLKSYTKHPKKSKIPISLQKKIEGIEIGVARYFNGKDWVGPIEFNIEHTRFLSGDNGPTVNEMGTLAWYSTNEGNRLYKETLAKLKPYLKKIKFKGDFDLNCIANEHGAFILEATPRFGSPIIHLHEALHKSVWGKFLYDIARGKSPRLDWQTGYGIVITIAVPPFPYIAKRTKETSCGILFSLKNLTSSEFNQVHFEGAALEDVKSKIYRVVDPYGYLMYITGIGASIKQAQKNVYKLIDKLNILHMIYRNDIGTNFVLSQKAILENWGYLDNAKKFKQIIIEKKNRALVA